MENKEKQKKAAAMAAASYIQDQMTIGLGTGSTALFLIHEAGSMLREGRRFQAVATSEAAETLAISLGIPIIRPEETERVDLAIDGVDEIDGSFCAVKGGGGALLREKIVAQKAEQVIWIMDESKPVKRLGTFPLPVEVLPFGAEWAAEAIRAMGGKAVCRMKDGRTFFTDNGNMILDVVMKEDTDLREAAKEIRLIPGVLETGIFDRICSRIIIGTGNGVRELVNPNPVKKNGRFEREQADGKMQESRE